MIPLTAQGTVFQEEERALIRRWGWRWCPGGAGHLGGSLWATCPAAAGPAAAGQGSPRPRQSLFTVV